MADRTITFNTPQILMLVEGLDTKLASVRRAMNTTKPGKFRELYEEEFEEFTSLKQKVAHAPFDPVVVPKK